MRFHVLPFPFHSITLLTFCPFARRRQAAALNRRSTGTLAGHPNPQGKLHRDRFRTLRMEESRKSCPAPGLHIDGATRRTCLMPGDNRAGRNGRYGD